MANPGTFTIPRAVKVLFACIGAVSLLEFAVLYVRPGAGTPVPVSRSSPIATDGERVATDVRFLIENGLLRRIDSTSNEAAVNPLLWNGVSAEAKKGIINTLSRHFELAHRGGHVKITDAMSGRTLAELSAFSGYTFY